MTPKLTAARTQLVEALGTLPGLTVRNALPDATPSEPLAIVLLDRASPDQTACAVEIQLRIIVTVPQTEPGPADDAVEDWHDRILSALPASASWDSSVRTVYRDTNPAIDITVTVRE
jgi:hypothetical protein